MKTGKTNQAPMKQSSPVQAKAQNQRSEGYILQAYKNSTSQLQSMEEEEPVQGKFETAQLAELGEEDEEPAQRKENKTGLPDNLKSGVENLSGHSMDDVKVHYNSAKPTELQAHAYAQGTDIHVAPGQEKHLPHEAWHVVQQKQGRVQATTQMKGTVPVNDDAGLEKEADVMGAKSLVQMKKKEADGIDTVRHTFKGCSINITGNALHHGYSRKSIRSFLKGSDHTAVKTGNSYSISFSENEFVGYEPTGKGVIVTHCGPFGKKKTAQL